MRRVRDRRVLHAAASRQQPRHQGAQHFLRALAILWRHCIRFVLLQVLLFVCDECNTQFVDLTTAKEHLRSHADVSDAHLQLLLTGQPLFTSVDALDCDVIEVTFLAVKVTSGDHVILGARLLTDGELGVLEEAVETSVLPAISVRHLKIRDECVWRGILGNFRVRRV